MAATVHTVEDFRRSPTSALFQGREAIGVSMFILAYSRGQGPHLHQHPYAEVFLVQEGEATFTVGDEQITVEAERIVVVPPETPHGFKCSGDGTLRVVSVHPSPEVIQTDLE